MKGLLYKDFHALWRTSKILLVLSAGSLFLYVFQGQKSVIVILLLTYAAMFISSSISTLSIAEYNTRWSMFVGTLPLSHAKIVFEKYLYILILSSGATVFYGIVLVAYKLIYNRPYHIGNFADLMAPTLLFAIIIINSCINQISTFCFDPLKGSSYSLLLTLLCFTVFSLISTKKSILSAFLNADPVIFSISVFCTALAVLGLSFGISYLVYRKRDLV